VVANDCLAQSRQTITVATHIQAPFIELIDGKFIGRNAEIAYKLAATINKKIEFIECPFARCLSMTRDGHADMMVAIRKTKDREQYLNYLTNPLSRTVTPIRFFLLKNDLREINHYKDITNLNIGVLRGASYFPRFDQDQSLKKIPITTHKQLIAMLLKGRIDTFLGREISIKLQTDPHSYQDNMKMARYIYKNVTDIYIAVSKHSYLNEHSKLLSENLDKLLKTKEVKKLFPSEKNL
jgi:polar amino acid transport system substrate-binding protein